MKGIITVLGKDKVGIIAAVCTYLSERQVNILDISQTIVQGFFSMLMIVDMPAQIDFAQLANGLRELGEGLELEIKLQREDIFESMHRI
ncbi:MAG: ACT domain-containing protein [Oscillospiraceae bacterium]|nr:ACT domain-containing protein [Oscillospiraceae bacterium]